MNYGIIKSSHPSLYAFEFISYVREQNLAKSSVALTLETDKSTHQFHIHWSYLRVKQSSHQSYLTTPVIQLIKTTSRNSNMSSKNTYQPTYRQLSDLTTLTFNTWPIVKWRVSWNDEKNMASPNCLVSCYPYGQSGLCGNKKNKQVREIVNVSCSRGPYQMIFR